MIKSELRQFIEEILDINPGMAGLGSASSAIIGTIGAEGAAGERLHKSALAFASEMSQPTPNHDALLELAKVLEGSLLTVKMVSGISDAKLDKLISMLHSFIS